MTEPIKLPELFVVRHYGDDERPCIKGNGFDGLTIGEDREEAEQFVAWVNARLAVEQNTAELHAEVEKLRADHATLLDNASIEVRRLRAESNKIEAEAERLRAELLNIADISKRHDIAKCDGLAEWADWAQNRARHAALKGPK